MRSCITAAGTLTNPVSPWLIFLVVPFPELLRWRVLLWSGEWDVATFCSNALPFFLSVGPVLHTHYSSCFVFCLWWQQQAPGRWDVFSLWEEWKVVGGQIQGPVLCFGHSYLVRKINHGWRTVYLPRDPDIFLLLTCCEVTQQSFFILEAPRRK